MKILRIYGRFNFRWVKSEIYKERLICKIQKQEKKKWKTR